MQEHLDPIGELREVLAKADPEGLGAASRNDARPGGGVDTGERPRMLTLPTSLRSAEFRVQPSAVVGAAVVLVVLLAVLGIRTAWAQRSAEPEMISTASTSVDVASVTATAGVTGAGATGVLPTESNPAPRPTLVFVHVIGAVAEPSVVEVDAGARVSEAVEAAGGSTQEADLTRLNLARVVVDGERIWVPVRDEEPPAEAVPVSGGMPAAPSSSGGREVESEQTVLDLNQADSATLQSLPGVGPVTAEAILAWRSEHGQFSTVDELVEVSGIGPRTLETLRPHVSAGP